MKYSNILLIFIFFICTNIHAQEKDTTITNMEESSNNDADNQQEKTNIENEENQSVVTNDEKNDIPLEYVIPTYDKNTIAFTTPRAG